MTIDQNMLTDGEKLSPLVKRICDALNTERALMHKKNEGDHDAIKTAKLRGRISVLRELLAAMDSKEPPLRASGQEGATDDVMII